MKLTLVVSKPGKNDGRAIPITLPSFLIGRDPECHLRPASSMVSKRHCVLSIRHDQVFVRDLASMNGTFVNGQQIEGVKELHHGDLLKVGPLTFTVDVEMTAAIDHPTPWPARPAKDKDIGETVAAMLLALDAEDDLQEQHDQDLAAESTIMEARSASISNGPVKDKAAPERPRDCSSAAKAILKKFRHGNR